MKIRSTRALSLMSALMLAPMAHAQTPTATLTPSTPWNVDYAAEECRLLRSFGTGDDAVTMRLARGSGLQSFDIVLAGKNLPKLGSDLKILMTLAPQGVEESFDGYSMAVSNRPERFIRWYDGSPEILAAITNDQEVRLTATDKFDVSMLWTDGKAALEALQTCHYDLLKSWGVDVDALRSAQSQPVPTGNPARWASPKDYPGAAIERNEQGTVTFLLTVSATGGVENCKILLSSKIALLDQQSCKIAMARAKFTPAVGVDGQPVMGYYINRFRWSLPE